MLQAVVRTSYGRLLSYLAYRWQNLAAAEDALADALAQALKTWPKTGVPTSPDAWLMLVAKRYLLQNYRHDSVALQAAADPAFERYAQTEELSEQVIDDIPDRRLKLLFVCAHPAIDASLHTALMLQTVLGLDAARIAQAYALPTATLAQRLVRAKQKIKLAGIRFEEPDMPDLSNRLMAVLEAIYAAYSLENSVGEDLSSEAIYLASLVAQLLPDQAEVLGLWSLLLSCTARRAAQYGPEGEFIPLHDQNPLQWNKAQIEEANALLYRACAMRQPGAFQLEAAIQSAHCQKLYTGQVPWAGIVSLYAQLLQISPTLGGSIAYAAALIETGDVVLAQRTLENLEAGKDAHYLHLQVPYWLTHAHLAKACQELKKTEKHLQTALEVLMQAPQTQNQAAQIQYIQSQIVLCKT